MANKKLGFALGLALAFAAVQAPHIAKANGGGEFEDIGQFTVNHRVGQQVRSADRQSLREQGADSRQVDREKTRKPEGRGFLGRLFTGNGS